MKISNSSLLSSAITRRARAGGLILSFAALVMLMAAGCKAKQETPAAVAPEQLNAGEVAITPALKENLKFGYPEMADVIGTLQVAARVQTNAKQIAHVGSPVKGRILKLLVFEGQHVTAGTVLATLHSTELSDTQFALVKAASQQNLAAAAEKRAEQLVHADVIGRAELERRGAELLQATTEADSYHTQLLGLGMTEAQIRRLETTHKLSADYPIIAPRTGTVLKREVTIGQVVQPADPAFTIADLPRFGLWRTRRKRMPGSCRKGCRWRCAFRRCQRRRSRGGFRLSRRSLIQQPARLKCTWMCQIPKGC
jgi:cobalt-zinc-cadmium efflux system membrane fusion protein